VTIYSAKCPDVENPPMALPFRNRHSLDYIGASDGIFRIQKKVYVTYM
jgi:hypothetical protein